MLITEKAVRERLRLVVDPELEVNIVDLGLIYDIKLKMKNKKLKIKILMTLTSPGCPLAEMFEVLVKNALRKIPGLDHEKDVEVDLTFDPPWSVEMMSEVAKAELGFDD